MYLVIFAKYTLSLYILFQQQIHQEVLASFPMVIRFRCPGMKFDQIGVVVLYSMSHDILYILYILNKT